jgi:microcystin degradation protein MlrC
MKIFMGGIATETNSFAPMPTGWISFKEGMIAHGNATACPPEPFSAPMHVWKRMAQEGDHVPVEGLFAFAQPGGPTVAKVYEMLRDELLGNLEDAGSVEIVLLGLHGAMIADGYDDCEGDLIARVRKICGPNTVIGAELDPHCHLTEAMLDNADLLICFKEYPHVDIPQRAEELFALAVLAAEGSINPVMADFDCHMINAYHTPREPMRSFVDSMSAAEGKNGLLSLSLAHGFPWGDNPRVGTRMLVIADGDAGLAKKTAEEFGRRVFGMRPELLREHPDVSSALDQAEGLEGPVVLADVADNAGGGAPSDATFILREVIDRGLEKVVLGIFWDPVVVRICREAGEGAELDLRIGGKCGPMSGDPVDLRVRVMRIKDDLTQRFGPTPSPLGHAVWLKSGGIDLVVNDLRSQTFHPEAFTGFGIDLSAQKMIVVKSSQHFYAGFAPLASEVIYVSSPGAINPDFTTIPYTKRKRDFWPAIEEPEL